MKDSKGFRVKTCEDCGKDMKRFRIHQGKFLCFGCYRKRMHIMVARDCHLSLEKALERTYEIKGYLLGDNSIRAIMSLPSILIGHKVKLVLVE